MKNRTAVPHGASGRRCRPRCRVHFLQLEKRGPSENPSERWEGAARRSAGPARGSVLYVSARKLRVSAEKLHFSVDAESGDLLVKDRIDREQICKERRRCELQLEAVVENPLNIFHIIVVIEDVNDHAPQFDKKEIHLEIFESASAGARISLDPATDPDININSIKDYKINSNPYFSLMVRVNSDGGKYPELSLEKLLDREEQRSHSLILTALDGGDPPRSATAHIQISVKDTNDNPPVFSRDEYRISVSESLPPGSPVLQVTATDQDEGVNAEINYYFRSTAQSTKHMFLLDEKTGMIKNNQSFDFEDVESEGTLPYSYNLCIAHTGTKEFNFLKCSAPIHSNEDMVCSVSPGALIPPYGGKDLTSHSETLTSRWRKVKLQSHTEPLGAAVGQCRASADAGDPSASSLGFPAQPTTERRKPAHTHRLPAGQTLPSTPDSQLRDPGLLLSWVECSFSAVECTLSSWKSGDPARTQANDGRKLRAEAPGRPAAAIALRLRQSFSPTAGGCFESVLCSKSGPVGPPSYSEGTLPYAYNFCVPGDQMNPEFNFLTSVDHCPATQDNFNKDSSSMLLASILTPSLEANKILKQERQVFQQMPTFALKSRKMLGYFEHLGIRFILVEFQTEKMDTQSPAVGQCAARVGAWDLPGLYSAQSQKKVGKERGQDLGFLLPQI
ncbi:hypothetical protein H8959_021311 [Pygathrix nigripes]